MDDYKTKLVQYVAKSIHDVCPYGDENLQRMYHLGFMQAFIAEVMLDDNKNLSKFKKIIEQLKE